MGLLQYNNLEIPKTEKKSEGFLLNLRFFYSDLNDLTGFTIAAWKVFIPTVNIVIRNTSKAENRKVATFNSVL